MTGREPDKQNNYYNPKVVWLLVILVGVAVMVVGLSIFAEREPLPSENQPADMPTEDSAIINDFVSSAPDSLPEISPVPVADSLPWLSFNQALDEVDGTARSVMIYFRSTECPPCNDMQNQVFSQEQIFLDLQYEFLPVKIEQGSNQQVTYNGREMKASGLADIFGIPGYPTLLFYDGLTAKYVLMLGGFCDSERLRLTFQFLRERRFENDSNSLDQYLSEQGYKSPSNQ